MAASPFPATTFAPTSLVHVVGQRNGQKQEHSSCLCPSFARCKPQLSFLHEPHDHSVWLVQADRYAQVAALSATVPEYLLDSGTELS